MALVYAFPPNELCQIHNYSFSAIKSFIQEVKKYPVIYNGNDYDSHFIDLAWSGIVSGLLENSFSILNPSERAYWDRIYRELWRWMYCVYEAEVFFSESSSKIILSNVEKFSWMADLVFLKPYICLSSRSMQEQDPYVYITIESTADLVRAIDPKQMVFWQHFDRTFLCDSMYFHICVIVTKSDSMESSQNTSEIEDTLNQLCDGKNMNYNQVSALPLGENNHGSNAENMDEEKNILTFESVDDFLYVMGILTELQKLQPHRSAQVKMLMIHALADTL